MARRLFTLSAAASLLLCVGVLVLRWRSTRWTDAFLVPLPRGKALIVRSNAGTWFDVTLVTHGWAGGGGGAWAMPRSGAGIGLGDHGPQAFWNSWSYVPIHPWQQGYERDRWELIRGELDVVREPATGLASFDRSGPHAPPVDVYTRRFSPSPYWVRVRAWNLRAPHGGVAAAAGVLPAAWAVAFAVRRVRGFVRDRALREGLCRSCGYDLRATPGRCPECGRPAGPNAVAPLGP